MVKPDPDVPHALHKKLPKLGQERWFLSTEALQGRLGRHDGRVGHAIQIHPQQAPVKRVLVKQQAVVHAQLALRGRTGASQLEHGIGAIGVFIHLVLGDLQRTDATALQGEGTQGPGGYLRVAGAQLTPSDLAVAIGIQPDGKVNVPQGNVPLASHVLTPDIKHQIAVAGLVRQHRGTHQQQHTQ